ncbi:MAG TPA: hypothetical protein VGN07_01500 [Steroidobacteraceae bacterium]
MSILKFIRDFRDQQAQFEAERLLHADLQVIYEFQAGALKRMGVTKKERSAKRASHAAQFFRKVRRAA